MGLLLINHVARMAARARDFAQLCELCHGAWPIDVIECLEEISSRDNSTSEKADALIDTAYLDLVARAPRSALPLEHPLDGDWRFTERCAAQLLRKLLQLAGSEGRVLLIGMPTIALAAAAANEDHRIFYAARASDSMLASLRMLVPRAAFIGMDEVTAVRAACGAVDPPWYDEIAIPLIQRASIGLIPGGNLIVCGPDELTRTSAATVFRLKENLRLLGFSSASFSALTRYQTPFFEAQALMAAGVSNVSPHWRTGRAHLCRRSLDEIQLWDIPTASISEVYVQESRIWLRSEIDSPIDETVNFLVSSTVSRTDPLRSQAFLWTSGNTVGVGGIADQQEGRWQQAFVEALSAERRAFTRWIEPSEEVFSFRAVS